MNKCVSLVKLMLERGSVRKDAPLPMLTEPLLTGTLARRLKLRESLVGKRSASSR